MNKTNTNQKIDGEKFYTPKQVLKLGVMTANTPDTQWQMLLRFIREGRIKSVNVGGERKPRYLVQGKDLISYRDSQVKKGEYLTK